jgi:hypothetical protein
VPHDILNPYTHTHTHNPQESEYKKHLAELDTALSAAIPQAGVPFHTHDLAYKSSSTPVRYLFELPVPVDTAGAHVSYRFATDEYDISFGVFFQGLDGHTETVLPSARVDSHYEPCSGDVTVHRCVRVCVCVCVCVCMYLPLSLPLF